MFKGQLKLQIITSPYNMLTDASSDESKNRRSEESRFEEFFQNNKQSKNYQFST